MEVIMTRRSILFSTAVILFATALITTIVGRGNHPPTANYGSVTTQEDTPVSISLVGSDPDGDMMTYNIVTGPSHGSLSGTAPNLTYTPEADFSGSDSLAFNVNDSTDYSASATVSVTVTGVNDPPAANDDTATLQEDTPVVTVDVLANDADVDNDRLIVITATQGSNGSVTINTDSTLTYAPNVNSCGTDVFTYTLSDGKGGTDTANVNVRVNAVNDAPRITSKPVTTARVWARYTYDVDAKDPDPGDKLTYSLTTRPEGMTIDPAAGFIEWTPTNAQDGTYDVEVMAADSNSIPALDTQSFAVTVTSLSSPLTTTLTIADGYNQNSQKMLAADGKIAVVQTSDNNRLETESGSYISYDFCDSSIPAGATIISVVVHVEHFEQGRFSAGKLQWDIGTGWPGNPTVWASTNTPVREGARNETTDSWDVTSVVDTSQKIDSLQLQIKNNNNIAARTTLADHIYAVIEWY